MGKIPSISTTELASILSEKLEIIDVREADEYAQGHIPGAVNIPLAQIKDFKPETPVYLICRSGRRSKMAAAVLMERGYSVINVREGMLGWSGPIVKS